MVRPSGCEVMVVVVRRVVIRACVPSRAVDWRMELSSLCGRERRCELGRRGLGSVVLR